MNLIEIYDHWRRNYGSAEEIFRNPSGITRGLRRSYAYSKFMRSYKRTAKSNGEYHCYHCRDDKDLHGHHLISISVDSSMALVDDNIVLACRDCHFHICHNSNWKHQLDPAIIFEVSNLLNENTYHPIEVN